MDVRSLLLAALLGLTSCAPALSTFQPAHVAKKGDFQLEAGLDVAVPTSGVVSVVNAAETLVKTSEQRDLTEGEKLELYDAGAVMAVNALSPVPHIGVAYTPLDRFEVSLRYSGAIRLGVRYQLLEKARHGVDLSAGLGAARYTFAFPVGSVLGIVELEDFERWQFDLPLLVGTSGDWYRVWGGPKGMFTTYGTKLVLSIPSIPGVTSGVDRELASFEGNAFYVGGQAGVALGYKHVFLGVELSMAYLAASSEFAILERPVEAVDLDSFIVAPGIALMTEF